MGMPHTYLRQYHSTLLSSRQRRDGLQMGYPRQPKPPQHPPQLMVVEFGELGLQVLNGVLVHNEFVYEMLGKPSYYEFAVSLDLCYKKGEEGEGG